MTRITLRGIHWWTADGPTGGRAIYRRANGKAAHFVTIESMLPTPEVAIRSAIGLKEGVPPESIGWPPHIGKTPPKE